MLQGALLALMGRCLRVYLTMLAWLAGMLLLARPVTSGYLCDPGGPWWEYTPSRGGRTEVLSRCSEGRPGAGGGSSASGRMGSPGGRMGSPGEVLVGNCDVITDGSIAAGHDGWSAPEMVGSSSGVVRAGCAVLSTCTDTTLVCADDYTECDILDQFETFNGMPVYYGGDLYD